LFASSSRISKKPQAWQAAVDNAATQLQHQQTKAENLELLIHYGPNAWRLYNEKLEDQRKRLVKVEEELRKEINETNLSRKNKQTPLAASFQNMDASWVSAVRKNIEIEKACCKLEDEIATLKRPSQDVEMHN